MEDEIKSEVRRIAIILVAAVCLFGIINTVCLLSRIQELDEKIETLKSR